MTKIKQTLLKLISTKNKLIRPKTSKVINKYIESIGEPPWTSFFLKYEEINDDFWGKSHFNWSVGKSNYHILRTGCYPYIKYHCTKRPYADLTADDTLFRLIKILNLGIPCLAYGIAAKFLIKHVEKITVDNQIVFIYFLYAEDKGSQY